MKNFFSSIRTTLIPVSFVILATVLLAACSKFNDDDNGGNTPVAGLMAFNLAPDKASVGIALSGNNLTNAPLAYTNYTGTYQRIYTGNRAVESYDYHSDSSIAAVNYNFEGDKYYSLFVAGANGVYTNIIAHDNFDSLSSSAGKIYYVISMLYLILQRRQWTVTSMVICISTRQVVRLHSSSDAKVLVVKCVMINVLPARKFPIYGSGS